MKIRLISPRNPKSFWTFDGLLPILEKRCIFPNLALPTVAGLTPTGWDVEICDENVEDVDLDSDADIVGITGFIVHKQRIFELIDELKRRGKFVVVGGPYATLCPEDFRGRVDVLFVGESEETWPRFLEDFAAGSWQTEYKAEQMPDLSDSALPRFDLLKLDRYRTITMQFARGCPFNCEFCDIIVMYGRKPRMKAAERALAEVEELHRLGVTNVFLVDDNFIGNKNVAKAFLRELVAWQREHDYPIDFFTEVSLNLARDAELMELLRDANFSSLFIGIESPSKESLNEAKKTQNTRDDLLESVHRIQEYGFQIDAGMIVGFDADDSDIFERHFRFIQEARIPISMTGLLNAMPKTPLHTRLAKSGRLLAESTGDQFVFTNIIPNKMSNLQLYEGYRDLLHRLYDFDHFRRRTLDFILRRGERLGNDTRVKRSELRIVRNFIRECLIRGSWPRRRMTLRILLETLWRRPTGLRDAIVLTTMHKHFHEYVTQITAPIDAMCRELREAPDQANPLPLASAAR